MDNQIPVYLFTGFLEGGKTKFIQETLEDRRFNRGEPTLLLVCEEGVEEYEPEAFSGHRVTLQTVENESDLDPETLTRWLAKAEAERVKTLYRTAYRAEGVYECAPIAGAEECLRALKAAGAHIAVATSKPIRFAREILQRFGFDGYFDAVCGAESDAHSGKAEIVRRAMQELGADPAQSLMVGDRKYDVLGARACGIPCIVLDSGFAEPGEYEEAGAAAVFADYPSMQAYLLA